MKITLFLFLCLFLFSCQKDCVTNTFDEAILDGSTYKQVGCSEEVRLYQSIKKGEVSYFIAVYSQEPDSIIWKVINAQQGLIYHFKNNITPYEYKEIAWNLAYGAAHIKNLN